MNAAVGHSAVLLGLVGALVGIAVLGWGLARGKPGLLRAGQSYPWLVLLAAAAAVGAMEHALVTRDFSLAYVAQNDGLGTPLLFRITGMWSALQGSLLLWTLILAGYLAAVAWHFRRRATDPLVAWATLVGLAVAAFFFGLLLVGAADPFRTVVGAAPTNGPGPNPLLQDNPLVAFHPPMLYLGFVGFTVPFMFAVAALVTGRVGEGWLVETRRWTLFAWGFLTLGLVLGMFWSYEVLGWGGYWSWDPVENAALLPWLTGTAFLHSVMVQERRGMLRVWNLSLVLATFALTIFGTFLTRSGVLVSVHSFSTSSVGPVILAFFGAVLLIGVGLIVWRGEQLRSPGSIDSPLSREGAFLANNLAFGAFAFVILLGTVFPLLFEVLHHATVSVGAPYFDTMTAPLALTLLFLMAVAPALPWRKASASVLLHRLRWPAAAGVAAVVATSASGLHDVTAVAAFGLGAVVAVSALRQLALSFRQRGFRGLVGRVNGGMVVHLGVAIMAVAFAASAAYGQRGQLSLRPGQTARFDGHTITYLGTRTRSYPNRRALEAELRLDGGPVVSPAISVFSFGYEGIGTPAIDSGLTQDVYLTLDSSPVGHGPTVIGVVVQPLIAWLWIGGGVMGLGAALAAFPGRRRRPTAPASAPGGADALPEPALAVTGAD
ncbi:MAG: heme lyase CcmF/NrfE family subunit [Actinomycetota bacterium]|jgi:cytochrome c-type biogenesis protein CcmF|nr:heme lyase CcmF/NrfE family subunit [Actinomycetota bacterium]